MSAANVVALNPDADLDLDDVYARAGSLDFLAELVDAVVLDGMVEVDATLPERLRALADELVDHASRPHVDSLAINRALARSVEVLREATVPICRSSTRRMLGGPLYERIAPAVITLCELGSVAFERAMDDEVVGAVGVAPMRRFTRVIAQAYDWAQWNVDAPVRLHGLLVEAIERAGVAARDDVDITHELAPTDAVPLARALDELLDAWLASVPADVLAEFVEARDEAGLAGSFDLGVACSIARRLVPEVGDDASIAAWRVPIDA